MRYLLSLAVLLLSIPAQAATVYFAQVADGGGYSTTITIFNPNTVAVSGTLTFYKQSGSQWSLKLNSATNSFFAVNLAPSGSVRLTTGGTGSAITSGWASLETTAPVRGVATYDVRSQGNLVETVGVMAASSVKRFMLPIDVGTNLSDVGVAVANVSSTTPVTVKFTLTDESGGNPRVVTDPKLNNLGPLNQVAQFVTASFPAVTTGFKGTLVAEVVGFGDIAATGLIYKDGCTFGCAAAIPVSDLGAATTQPSSDPKIARMQEVVGDWTFNYTIVVPWTDRYHLTSVVPDPANAGEYLTVGLSDEGTPAKAYWNYDLKAYTLFEAEVIANELYVFNFIGSNTVSGCYYMQYVADSTTSDCYPVVGVRTPLPSSPGISQEAIQSQKAMEGKSVDRGQNNPVIRELMDKLKQKALATPDPH